MRLVIVQVVEAPGEGQFHVGPDVCEKDTNVIRSPTGTLLGNVSVKLALPAALDDKFLTVIV